MKNKYSTAWLELFLEPIQPIQTEKEIAFLTYHLPNPPYKTILDVCCGQGRHSNSLAAKGYHITGIDLNQKALEKAERTSNGQTVYRKTDMRNLGELPGSFDAMVNLWQSFGYFDESTNRDILQQMSDKLNPMGRLVLDIYHRGFFEKHQGLRTFETSGLNITETKYMSDNRLMVKLDYDNIYEPDSFEWQLYTPDEIRELAQEMGLTCLIICTNFDEQQEATDNSPRMQIVFEKQ